MKPEKTPKTEENATPKPEKAPKTEKVSKHSGGRVTRNGNSKGEKLRAYGRSATNFRQLAERLKALSDWHMGKMRAENGGVKTVGQLPFGYRFGENGVFQATYVVYSYDTPIAWVVNGEWVQPEVKYSITTTKHQGKIAVAISVLSETE